MSEPDRISTLERDARNTSLKVEVLATRFDHVVEGIDSIKDEMKTQTKILSSFVILQEKHQTLAKKVDEIERTVADLNGSVSNLEKFKSNVRVGLLVISLFIGVLGYFGDHYISEVNRQKDALYKIESKLKI